MKKTKTGKHGQHSNKKEVNNRNLNANQTIYYTLFKKRILQILIEYLKTLIKRLKNTYRIIEKLPRSRQNN